ncbi:MAG TPA: hypothetical protein VE219_06525 [Candidatus Sulfotelmatobacter sp.]|jgi:hypothetical protein|nr:hypothetical protein [Candidatus Sulfotelmatobacter sp.]
MTGRDERPGITPRSWTGELHEGILHLGKRWYVVSAELDEEGKATGVRLDGPYPSHEAAAAKARSQEGERRGDD